MTQQSWDVVVDVVRQPERVRRAVQALAQRAASSTFVSTGVVFADHSKHNSDETSALLPTLDGEVMVDLGSFDEAKVACKHAVASGFGPDRYLIARAGLIGGPGDVPLVPGIGRGDSPTPRPVMAPSWSQMPRQPRW